MRKYICFILLGLSWTSLFGQLEIRPLPKHLSEETEHARFRQQVAPQDTMLLPFWDDFYYSGPDPDTSLWRHGADILVNGTLGIAPPTLNVATFDGLNAIGIPYDIASDFVGPTDSLVSQYIDLSQVPVSKRNTVFMSFFWQMKGRGEQPDENDSIRLQFLNASNQWITQWSVNGAEQNLNDFFEKEYIQITDPQFFHEGFSMKFQSFGKTTGPFDAWHIDYVYVNQDRTNINESIFDHSIASEPVSIFKTYTSIPYAQLFAFPDTILNPVTFEVATQDLTVAQAVLVFYTVTDINSGNILLQDLTQNTITPLNIPPDNKKRDFVTTQVNLTQADFDPALDSIELEIELSYQSDDGFLFRSVDSGDTTFLMDPDYNYRVNDTLRQRIEIKDVFSYDDGVADFAAGLNRKNGQISLQYVLAEQDTITHLDIYFPQIKPSAEGQFIDLLVLRDLSGDLGSILTQQQVTVQFSDSINKFTRYELDKPVVVNDSIYVGFKQNTNNYIGIGLDKNNPQGDKIYFNIGNGWEPNIQVEGSLMIRPVLRNVDFTVVNNIGHQQRPNIRVFPNPANRIVKIEGEVESIGLYTIYGQKLPIAFNHDEFNVSHIPNGIYILKAQLDSNIQTFKLIINH